MAAIRTIRMTFADTSPEIPSRRRPPRCFYFFSLFAKSTPHRITQHSKAVRLSSQRSIGTYIGSSLLGC